MKRRDWFKCFLALPFISVLRTEAKEKEYKFPKEGVNSFEYLRNQDTPGHTPTPMRMETSHTLRYTPTPTPTPSCTLNRCGTRCEPCAEDQYIIYGSPKATYYKIERQYLYKKNRPKFNG